MTTFTTKLMMAAMVAAASTLGLSAQATSSSEHDHGAPAAEAGAAMACGHMKGASTTSHDHSAAAGEQKPAHDCGMGCCQDMKTAVSADNRTRLDREAAEHEAYAKSWRASAKAPNAAAMADHCEKAAADLRAKAEPAAQPGHACCAHDMP